VNNLDKYDSTFVESLGISKEDLPTLKYQDIPSWDSIGHMGLMAALENAFEIMLDMDDILDFSSYETGKQILAKFQIEL
jgi:acyl carrier protein